MSIILKYPKDAAIEPKVDNFKATLAAAADLNKSSAPAQIEAVLRQAVKAALAPIEMDKVISAVRESTGVRRSALQNVLDLILIEANPNARDKARLLAQSLLKHKFNDGGHLLRSADGGYWTFNGRHWRATTDAAIGNSLMREAVETQPMCGNMQQLVGNAKKTLDLMLGDDQDLIGLSADPLPVVNCANGEVWLDESGEPELRPHDPGSRLTYCLPVIFDPPATCPAFDDALLGIFAKSAAPVEMARHWNELAGYAIQPRRDIASFWLLIGHGANGKSKLLQTLQQLLGPDAVMNAPIAKFQSDRFNVAALVGKLLFIDDDIGAGTHLDDGLLKAISEAKDMSARHAYGARHFKFRCLALPIMAGNHYPTTADNSRGLRRRAMVIPFDRQFGPDDDDKELFTKIWAKEMPGVLNRALEGLARLRKRGEFAPPEDCIRAAREFMAHANPLVAFLEDEVVANPGGHVLLHDFRAAMTKWATEQGMKKPVPNKTLKRELEGLRYEVKMVAGYHRVYGVQLKS
jgi:P4 family phage/plasmid primase-like protien